MFRQGKDMKTKIVGKVEEQEKKEIQSLFGAKKTLEIIADNIQSDANERLLYERLKKDLRKNCQKSQAWWDKMQKKYNWESAPGGHWQINFNTNEIILNINKNSE